MLTLTTVADLDALAPVRTLIAQGCRHYGIGEQLCSQLQLTVDELCTNIILHGYANQTPGEITVTFAYNAPQIQILLEDHGTPFDPRYAPPPDLTADWAARTVGGLGIYLAQQVVDRLEYTSHPVAGNRLRLIKEWKGPPHDNDL